MSMIFVLITARERAVEAIIESCADLAKKERDAEIRQDLIAVRHKLDTTLKRFRDSESWMKNANASSESETSAAKI